MTNYDVSTFFEKSRSMELANNIYGFTSTATAYNATGELTGDTNNFDTHMIKNMEWGAVAYLTQSKYGRCTNGTCSEIYINNSSNHYTGRSGGSTYASEATYGTYSYDNYSISDSNEKTTKEDLRGENASTTGNIYGIYDMSGGAYDYVMGNMAAEGGGFNAASSETWSTDLYPSLKYCDRYTYGATYNDAIAYKRGKLGDATKETLMAVSSMSGGWYNDIFGFLRSGTPWFIRGGASGLMSVSYTHLTLPTIA